MKYFKSNNVTEIKDENVLNGIMIVDDSKFSRNILSDILKNEGFQVVAEAKNGLEAIEMTKEKKPKYIFLDVEMPILDGLGALPKLLEVDPEVHIIMCTAMGQKNIIVEAAKAGAKDYVLKPYKKENIVRVLSMIIESEAQLKNEKTAQNDKEKKKDEKKDERNIKSVSEEITKGNRSKGKDLVTIWSTKMSSAEDQDWETEDQDIEDQETKEQEAKEKEIEEQETKEKEIEEQETREQETKEQETKEREIKERETKEQESEEQEIEEDETKEREFAERETEEIQENFKLDKETQTEQDIAATEENGSTVEDKENQEEHVEHVDQDNHVSEKTLTSVEEALNETDSSEIVDNKKIEEDNQEKESADEVELIPILEESELATTEILDNQLTGNQENDSVTADLQEIVIEGDLEREQKQEDNNQIAITEVDTTLQDSEKDNNENTAESDKDLDMIAQEDSIITAEAVEEAAVAEAEVEEAQEVTTSGDEEKANPDEEKANPDEEKADQDEEKAVSEEDSNLDITEDIAIALTSEKENSTEDMTTDTVIEFFKPEMSTEDIIEEGLFGSITFADIPEEISEPEMLTTAELEWDSSVISDEKIPITPINEVLLDFNIDDELMERLKLDAIGETSTDETRTISLMCDQSEEACSVKVGFKPFAKDAAGTYIYNFSNITERERAPGTFPYKRLYEMEEPSYALVDNYRYKYLWGNRFDLQQEDTAVLSQKNQTRSFYNIVGFTGNGNSSAKESNANYEIICAMIRSYFNPGNRFQPEESNIDLKLQDNPDGNRIFTRALFEEGSCKSSDITMADVLKQSESKKRNQVNIQKSGIPGTLAKLVEGKAGRTL